MARCFVLKVFQFLGFMLLHHLAGCSAQYPRPEDWPPAIEITEGCPDIAGIYYNGPESVSGTSDSYLFDELTREGIWGVHECNYCPVEIRWANEERSELLISIQSYNEYNLSSRLEKVQIKQSESDFRCENGKLIVDYAMGFEAIFEGMLLVGSRTFGKAADGSLTRADKHDAYAHTWIYIPIVLQDVEEHARWGVYDEQLAALSNDADAIENILIIRKNIYKALAKSTITSVDNSSGLEYRNKLTLVEQAIQENDTTKACEVLLQLYDQSDGINEPPDLMTGEDLTFIAGQLDTLILSLSCR
jgi:hypothetical protein